MYTPAHFALDDDEAHALIDALALGTLVIRTDAGYDATLLPFLRREGHLLAHVSRANPLWRHPGEVLAVFNGPQGYVSPAWYPSKARTAKVVPTWNYVSVHVHGTVEAFHDRDRKRDLVAALTATHEARAGSDWAITDAPPDYIDAMLDAIVGLDVTVTRIEGKAKLSQNRGPEDIAGVMASSRDAPLVQAMRSVGSARERVRYLGAGHGGLRR